MAPNRSQIKKRSWYTLLILFLLMNGVAARHAWQFTHFSENDRDRTKDPDQISTAEKVWVLLNGISNPRPENNGAPAQQYTTLRLYSNKIIETWYIDKDSAKGTVILFHGYCGSKSSLLGQAEILLRLGYRVLLADFMGGGGSEGNQTTLGFREAEEVKTCYEYARQRETGPVYLYGVSMGAAAILKAIHDYRIEPAGIILECPYGSLYSAVEARFHTMGVPTFPMAQLLVFWGGLENGFWAYSLRPSDYARTVHCPVLLFYGAGDKKVSRRETETIFRNLKGRKTLRVYPKAGHADYLNQYQDQWTADVQQFLSGT